MRVLKRLAMWSILLAIAVVIGIAAFWPVPEKVEVALIQSGWMEVSVQEEGKTRIKDRYVVSAPVAGQLLRIELRPGDSIENGSTLLATIQPGDPSLLDARQIGQAEAAVDAARTQVERADARRQQMQVAANLAETTLGRLKKLRTEKSVSQTEYDQAEATFRSANEDLRVATFDTEIARFELQQAEATVKHFTSNKEDGSYQFEIKSPIDGHVLKVFQESATVVAPGTPLLEVGNPLDLEIVVDVLSSDAVQVTPGDSVEMTQWGGDRPLLGVVDVVEPAAFTRVSSLGVEEQRVNVVASFREPAETLQRLGDGYRVAARIIVWKEDAILKVPNSALFRINGRWAVFQFVNGKAQVTVLELGKRNEFYSQVLDGIEEGAQVIQYPSDLIQDGSLVEVLD